MIQDIANHKYTIPKSYNSDTIGVSYDQVYGHYKSLFVPACNNQEFKDVYEEEKMSSFSIFAGHELGVKNKGEIPHHSSAISPFIILFFVLLLFYSWIIHKSSLTLGRLFAQILNLHKKTSKNNEKSIFSLYYLLPLVFISCCSFTLLIYQTTLNITPLERFSVGIELVDLFKNDILSLFAKVSDWSFVKIFMFIFGLLVLKLVVYRFLTILFKQSQAFQVYWNALAVNSIFFSVASLPFVVFSFVALSSPSFRHINILIGLSIALVYLVYRFFYLLILLTKGTKFSYFHILLYLCTLEILAVLVFYKVLTIVSIP